MIMINEELFTRMENEFYALSELYKKYTEERDAYMEEIEQVLNRVNARLDELFKEIAGV